MRSSLLVFMFIVAGAAGAWLLFQQEKGPGPCIDVLPATHQTIQSSTRGDSFIVPYRVINKTGGDLRLLVADKSCTCINVTLDRDVVKPGERVEVTLQGTMPLSGSSDGTARILARATDDSVSERGCEVTLTYVVESVRGPGLEVVPRKIELPSSGPIPDTCAISLSCFGIGHPLGLLLADSTTGESIPFAWVMSWSDDRAGGYAAVIELPLHDISEAPAEDRITCFVECESGETAAADLEIIRRSI